MKKIILLIVFALISKLGISQCCKDSKKVTQHWALSTSLGYINVSNTTVGPRYQSNTWGSLNISYSTHKWNFGAWAGVNYWVNGKQPDLRLGVTTTYTIKKW